MKKNSPLWCQMPWAPVNELTTFISNLKLPVDENDIKKLKDLSEIISNCDVFYADNIDDEDEE